TSLVLTVTPQRRPRLPGVCPLMPMSGCSRESGRVCARTIGSAGRSQWAGDVRAARTEPANAGNLGPRRLGPAGQGPVELVHDPGKVGEICVVERVSEPA